MGAASPFLRRKLIAREAVRAQWIVHYQVCLSLSEGREKVATLKIYGASDDLIEVEGEIREEFSPLADEPSLLAFSDGTLLQIQYGAGNKAFWRIQPLIYGSASYSKVEATDEDENYSDVVTLEGQIRWVVCGYQWARAAK